MVTLGSPNPSHVLPENLGLHSTEDPVRQNALLLTTESNETPCKARVQKPVFGARPAVFNARASGSTICTRAAATREEWTVPNYPMAEGLH